MTQTDLSKLAETLSEAQRSLVIAIDREGTLALLFSPNRHHGPGLRALGLLTGVGDDTRLSKTGLEVLALLKDHSDGE